MFGIGVQFYFAYFSVFPGFWGIYHFYETMVEIYIATWVQAHPGRRKELKLWLTSIWFPSSSVLAPHGKDASNYCQ